MKYWIFTGGEKNELFHQLMSDLEGMENVVLIDKLPQIPEKYHKIWELHHNIKLNRFGTLPFRNLWYSYMPFDEKVLQGGEHCLIFNNVSAGYFESGLLKKWKKKYHLKLVFYFLDVYDSYYAKQARWFIQQVPFDFVYSFYQEDVRKYHFRYLDCYYSKLDVHDKVSQAETNIEVMQPDKVKKVFFWGTDGGRRPFIEAAAQRLADLGASGKFGICYTEAAEESKIISSELSVEYELEEKNQTSQIQETDLLKSSCGYKPAEQFQTTENHIIASCKLSRGIEIIYNQPMEYPEVVQAVQNSDIILDAVGDYSKGVSLRYYESFAYNKKLITNNPLVKKMRGYNPDRILVIDSPAEISKEFLEKELPGQEYENQFSPVHFIEELEKNW